MSTLLLLALVAPLAVPLSIPLPTPARDVLPVSEGQVVVTAGKSLWGLSSAGTRPIDDDVRALPARVRTASGARVAFIHGGNRLVVVDLAGAARIEVPVPLSSWPPAAIDLDGDGMDELVVRGDAGELKLFSLTGDTLELRTAHALGTAASGNEHPGLAAAVPSPGGFSVVGPDGTVFRFSGESASSVECGVAPAGGLVGGETVSFGATDGSYRVVSGDHCDIVPVAKRPLTVGPMPDGDGVLVGHGRAIFRINSSEVTVVVPEGSLDTAIIGLRRIDLDGDAVGAVVLLLADGRALRLYADGAAGPVEGPGLGRRFVGVAPWSDVGAHDLFVATPTGLDVIVGSPAAARVASSVDFAVAFGGTARAPTGPALARLPVTKETPLAPLGGSACGVVNGGWLALVALVVRRRQVSSLRRMRP